MLIFAVLSYGRRDVAYLSLSCNVLLYYVMETFLLLGLGTSEILLIVFIVLLLFGGRKIPELMRGLGKGIRNFKEGMNGVEKDADVADQSSGSTDIKKK